MQLKSTFLFMQLKKKIFAEISMTHLHDLFEGLLYVHTLVSSGMLSESQGQKQWVWFCCGNGQAEGTRLSCGLNEVEL